MMERREVIRPEIIRKALRTIKVDVLVLSVVATLFFVQPVTPYATFLIEPMETIENRKIDVYIVRCSDADKWWIGDTYNVEQGVLHALLDAQNDDFSELRLKGEQIETHWITSTQQFDELVANPPQHAVVINTHGEVIPIGDSFVKVQDDARSGGDAGNSFDTATITYLESFNGWMGGWDKVDYYGFMVFRALKICVRMTPLEGQDFDLALYAPSGYWRGQSCKGPGQTEGIDFWDNWGCMESGYWRLAVLSKAGQRGNYNVSIKVYRRPCFGGCPFLYVKNSSDSFVLENNLLPLSESASGDVEDYYKIMQPDSLALSHGNYELMILECERERDYFDKVQLLAVDSRDAGLDGIAVTQEGEVLSYKDVITPLALDDSGGNCTSLISGEDNRYWEGHDGDYLLLDFGNNVPTENGARLLMVGDYISSKIAYMRSIHVQVLSGEQWVEIACLAPTRDRWESLCVEIPPHLLSPQLQIKLSITNKPERLNFVALDVSPQQADIEVKSCELVSAVSNGKDVSAELLEADGKYAELAPVQRIRLTFKAPPTNGVRYFIFYSKGRYIMNSLGANSKQSMICDLLDEPMTMEGPPESIEEPPCGILGFHNPPGWSGLLNMIQSNCRNAGWIFTSVVGYPFYYVSNLNYGIMRSVVGEAGLQTFLNDSTECQYYNAHTAKIACAFTKEKMGSIYNHLPLYVYADRPFKGHDPQWSSVGYLDNDDGLLSKSVASIVLNTTNLMSGLFCHAGLATDVDRDGVGNTTNDDWLKGYIATALAVEEARAFLADPVLVTKNDVYTKNIPFYSSTLVQWGVGKWGDGETGNDYKYAELLFLVGGQYDGCTKVEWDGQQYHTYLYYLGTADFRLESPTHDVSFKIETYIKEEPANRTFIDELGWWAKDKLVGAFIPFYGDVRSLIKMVNRATEPPDHNQTGYLVWANGMQIDTNDNHWGLSALLVTMKFLYKGSGTTDYEFNFSLTSWITRMNGQTGETIDYYSITRTDSAKFTVYW